ncbi:MAG TPA: glycosyltransferase family 2 protein [Kofleriaceae bacterium]|nr:glycosyltransferase family 2 protein [Kofleriaceae bacterium]
MVETVLFVAAIASIVYWSLTAVAALLLRRGVPLVSELAPPPPTRWPKVSVIIPACNEATTIEAAVRSRLGEGYPNAEYIVVDDRSTDDTGAIIDRIARDDARVVPLHIGDLPPGWLGKVHAMHSALAHATGDFVLFSDADIHHEPGTMRTIVAHCEQHAIDHVAAFPTVWSSAFWVDAVMTTFLRILSVGSRAWKVADPRSKISIGGGTFNLVRRTALDRVGGLEPIAMEVVDDAGLGQLLKWSGARSCVLNARGFIGLTYYSSVREAVLGMEKNAFAALGRFEVARFAIMLGVICVLELAAPLALVFGGAPLLAGAAVVLAVVAQLAIARWLDRPLLSAVFAPVGILVFAFGGLRSMILTLKRGGIAWRGTHYPLAALRAGRRLVHI